MKADLYFHGEKRGAAIWSERARRAAAGLNAIGLGNGAKIGLLLPNGFDFIEAHVGIGLAGAIPVPISTHLIEADYQVLAKQAILDAIIATADLASRWGAGRSVRYFLVDSDAVDPRSWERLISTAPDGECVGTAPGQLFFTAGSTMTPKTVFREPLPSQLAALRRARFVRSWRMVDGMRTLVTGPLHHQAPLHYAMGALEWAERVVILDNFEPTTVLSSIDEHCVTHLHMVPRLMAKLADLAQRDREHYDVSTLAFVLHGAAACRPSVKRALIAWWGATFREYYATSEFGLISQIDTDEWLDRPTSVGRACEGVELEVRDLDSGQRLPAEHLGRVFIRSEDMPDFRYGEAGKMSQTRTRGEWVTVDDVGYIDGDGFLHLTGRADDIAIVSGVKLNAQTTRSALLELPYVDEALVEVVADQQRGDAFRAAIRLKAQTGDISAVQVQSDLRASLPPLAIPTTIAFVGQLPVLDSGKTITRYLDLDKARIDTSEGILVRGLAHRTPVAPRFPSGIDIVSKGVTGSTNDDAVALAPTAAGPLTLIWAEQQSTGRGRSGRSWTSPSGNVYWTMLLDTASDPPHSAGLVFVTALAVLSTIRAVTPGSREVETKWPNDTLIDGRKVSGSLIESAKGVNGQMRAVGIGINVVSFPAIGMIYPATCLRAEGSAAHRNEILTLLTASFLGYLDLWRSSGFAPLREEYLKSAYRFGETVSVRISPAQRITGVFHNVTEVGIELALASGKVETIGAGDLLNGGSPSVR